MIIPDNILKLARLLEKENFGVRVERYDGLSWKILVLYGDKYIGLIVSNDIVSSMMPARIEWVKEQFGV